MGTFMTIIGRNSLHWFFLRYDVHKLFGSLPVLTLTFWQLKLTSTSMNANTPVTRTGWNSLRWFLRLWCPLCFPDAETHAHTHRRTDPNTVCLRHCF